jgi:hypothetical protein
MSSAQEKGNKAVVCLTTFNRIDCARINQEIIKLNYRDGFPIVHACSSDSYEPYLEDVFTRCERKELRTGALDLLQRSLRLATEKYNPEYIVHLEGDTWIMNEAVIHDIISTMDKDRRLMICASAWDEDWLAFKYLKHPSMLLNMHIRVARIIRRLGIPYYLKCTDSLATQFFVIRATPEVIECFANVRYVKGRDLEQALYRSFMSRFNKHNVLRLRVREPIHPFNRYVCEKLSLYSQHWPAKGTANDSRDPTHPRYVSPFVDGKRETLTKFVDIRKGKYIGKLLSAESLDYYNPGAART